MQQRGIRLVALFLGLLALAAAPAIAEEMKPYTETIPGSDVKFDMVPIPAGTFIMGSPDNEADRKADEGPQHEVKINAFWMGKLEVTWDEYDIFAFAMDIKKKEEAGVDLKKQVPTEMAADAVTRPTPPYADPTFGLGHSGNPAICITHHAAMEYCRWLSAKTGKTYRLPTEAEWEYACRAGSKTAYSFGDDGSKLGEYAWFAGNSEGAPHPGGKKKPNAWGLYDMHGNAAEWCLDRYDESYFKNLKDTPALSPVVVPTEKKYPHSARGGSWDDDPKNLRSATRRASAKDWSRQDPQLPQSIWWHTDATFIGFRVICPLQEQENLKGLKSKVTKEGD